MIKHIKEGGKSGSEFELHITGDRGDASYTLVRSGKKWTPKYQGAKAIRVTSDGNSVQATVFKDHTGRKAEVIDLDFAEAAELAYTLLEYSKGDPFAPSPYYEVYDKEEVIVQRGDAINEAMAKLPIVRKAVKAVKKKAKRVKKVQTYEPRERWLDRSNREHN